MRYKMTSKRHAPLVSSGSPQQDTHSPTTAMKLSTFFIPVALSLGALPSANAGLIGYGICQTGEHAFIVSRREDQSWHLLDEHRLQRCRRRLLRRGRIHFRHRYRWIGHAGRHPRLQRRARKMLRGLRHCGSHPDAVRRYAFTSICHIHLHADSHMCRRCMRASVSDSGFVCVDRTRLLVVLVLVEVRGRGRADAGRWHACM